MPHMADRADEELKQRVAAWSKASRERLGLSQAAVVAAVKARRGVVLGRTQISGWENGKHLPEADNLAALEDIYGPLPGAATEPNNTALLLRIAETQERTAQLQRDTAVAIERLAQAMERRDEWEQRVLLGMRLDRRYATDTDDAILELLAAVTGTPRVRATRRSEDERDALAGGPQ